MRSLENAHILLPELGSSDSVGSDVLCRSALHQHVALAHHGTRTGTLAPGTAPWHPGTPAPGTLIHSYLSAMIGSIRPAFVAGINPASVETTLSSTTVPRAIVGSNGSIP